MNEIDDDYKKQENEIKYLKSLLDYDLVRIEKQSEIIKDFLNENIKLRHKIGELQFQLSQVSDYEIGDDYYG